MAIVKVKGIVISEISVNDYDKMIIMLTPNLGKISCTAKGAKRPKSTLLAATQFLCYGDYILYKNNTSDIYNINSCEIIELFYNMRSDLEKLEKAAEITKIITKVTLENQNCDKILQLYLNTLFVIANNMKNLDLVLSVFKLRLLAILGFCPNILNCVNCKSKECLNFFSFKENGFKCEKCSKNDKSGIKILEATKNAIQYTICSEAKKLYSFDIPLESIEELKIIANTYEKMHLNDF